MGLGVGVVGGGSMHALLSSFIFVPSWHWHSNAGSSSVETSSQVANEGHSTPRQGSGHSARFQVLQSRNVVLA